MRAIPKLVAIVEDDEPMRKSLERVLQAGGYVTEAFESAEDFLRSRAVDGAVGLVLDVHLGGMSGFDLQRQLIAAQSNLPIVFITAQDTQSTRAEAFALGCVDYLQKPFDPELLMQLLERGRAFKSR